MRWIEKTLGDWADEFLPLPGPHEELRYSEKPFKLGLSKDTAMYPDLAEMFNDYLVAIGCTDFVVRYTHGQKHTRTPRSTETRDHNPVKPHLAFLPTSTEATRAYETWHRPREKMRDDQTAPKHANDTAAGSSETTVDQPSLSITDTYNLVGPLDPLSVHTTWDWEEIVVEVTRGTRWNPFSDTSFPGMSPTREAARNRLAECAAEIFRHQHRQFVFIISICDDTARFLRFDRGGAVVSTSFNYIEHPQLMGDILHRLFAPGSNKELRGHDPTATIAREDDAKLFRDLHAKPEFQANTHLVAALTHAASADWPVYRIDIPYQWPSPDQQLPVRRDSGYPLTTRAFLVGRPTYTTSSATGRGTKCMVAYDKTARKPVFIKDVWRPDSSRRQTELETYQLLWEGADSATETHIPTCLGGGDVAHGGAVQRTRTPTHKHLQDEDHVPRVHSRIVLKEICRRLEEFEDSLELVWGVLDALIAHERAWKRGILHCDVSVGNILLMDTYSHDGERLTTVGLLADWELAQTEEQLDNFKPTQTIRSGTWQFMSAQLQTYRDKRHEVADDLESFIHVLDWCALMYLPHANSPNPEVLAHHIRTLYDEIVDHRDADGRLTHYSCTESKYQAAWSGENVVRGLPRNHPFTDMLSALHQLCRKHYSITRPCLAPAEAANEDMSRFMWQHSKLARFCLEPRVELAPATTSQGSQSMASTQPSMALEASPLDDHDHFIDAILAACLAAQDQGWPLLEKNPTQARLTQRNARITFLFSNIGSEHSGESDAPTPPKHHNL